ncbi:MAG: hypothetical protein EOP38_10360 [Rubrivivax sp.]|nr:MAG: hypothetical protein EOP38_10360 [Rubrivivax sp.]
MNLSARHLGALYLSMSVLMPIQASAALVSTVGQVTSLRIEGANGFVGYSPSMATLPSTCGARVWIDLTTPIGRTVYATALMAMATKQSVQIRAYEESTRVSGECNLYDVYVF